jgi:hypothetical protein
MNERRCRRFIMRATLAALVTGVGVGFPACGGSAAAPTAMSTSSAAIDSVVTTFRGAVVESSPVVIESPEVLSVEVKVTLRMPADSRMTMYVCVMETASAIGVGTCVAVTDTVANVQAQGNVLRMGISTFKTDGVSRTTNSLYVGLTDGAVPWPVTGTSPPRVGDMFGNNRVLATFQVTRTVTFR